MALRNDLIEESKASKKRHLFGEGRFAIGFVTGASTLLIAWLITNSLLSELLLEDLLFAAPTLGALFVALASLLVSYSVLTENRLMRQAGTDPVILVHLGKRDDAPMLTTIEVRNVGAGAAMEVVLEVLKGAPDFDSGRVLTDLTKLSHPIRVIPQNHSISYNFGLGHRLLGASEGFEPLEPIRLRVKYKDIEGAIYGNEQIVDVRELKSQQAHTPNSTKSANSLAEISKSLRQLSDGHKALSVITETKQESLAEKERFYEEMKQIGKD